MNQENGKTDREVDETPTIFNRPFGQLWQAPLFVVGLIAFIVTAVTASDRQDNILAAFQADLTSLRHMLTIDEEPSAAFLEKANALLESVDRFPQKAGEIHFVVGSAYFRLAKQRAALLAKKEFPNGSENAALKDLVDDSQRQAITHFEEANALGVAAEDTMALSYRLGIMLFQQGKEPIKAIELMTKSVEKGADQPVSALGFLVRANLALTPPNVEAALAANAKQLELIDDRHPDDKAQARLLRGQLLLRKDETSEALTELKRIGPTAPRDLRIQARLLQIKICEEQGHWNEDIELWKALLPDADAIPGGKVHALYALGQACRNAKPPRLEEALASWNEAFALGGDEGAAAGIRLGELMLSVPNPNIEAVLKIWARVLQDVHSPSDYKIQCFELRRGREIFEEVCQYLKESQDYLHAQQVAGLYKRIAPPGAAEERLAQAAEGLARQWLEKIQTQNPAEATAKMAEIRQQFQLAADVYKQAAEASPDNAGSEVYWRCAQCYLEIKDFAGATQALHKFVETEKSENRLAEGWLTLAESYSAAGNKDNARAAFYKCIELPTTPFAFRARYRLALDEMDKKNYVQALAILMDNLNASGPVQDRAASENSIFKVAELLFLQQKFDQAALYFKKACVQYPLNEAVIDARDRLGDCYYRLAKQEAEKMEAAQDEGARSHYKNSRMKWLKEGADVLETLADELGTKARERSLTPNELGLLRKALFATADMRFEMNDFAEALRRYEDLQDKYRTQVEGLIACQRIFRCNENITEPPQLANKARGATERSLKKAIEDLDKMPEDSLYFRATTENPGVWPKSYWLDFVHHVERLLHPAASAPTPPPLSTPINPPK
jgi:tetratricopeptide (TPR) repeat protein